MKKIIIASSLLLSVAAFGATAKAPTFKLDCSKAEGGEVSLTSSQKRFSAKEAAAMAYKCFVDKNAVTVQQARNQAIAASKDSNPGESCGTPDESGIELSTENSWVSGRPDVTTVNGVEFGEMSGSFVLSVRENFICSGVGTGLFEGVTSAAITKVNVEESYKFNFKNNKGKQVVIVKIAR